MSNADGWPDDGAAGPIKKCLMLIVVAHPGMSFVDGWPYDGVAGQVRLASLAFNCPGPRETCQTQTAGPMIVQLVIVKVPIRLIFGVSERSKAGGWPYDSAAGQVIMFWVGIRRSGSRGCQTQTAGLVIA